MGIELYIGICLARPYYDDREESNREESQMVTDDQSDLEFESVQVRVYWLLYGHEYRLQSPEV